MITEQVQHELSARAAALYVAARQLIALADPERDPVAYDAACRAVAEWDRFICAAAKGERLNLEDRR